MQVFSGRMNAPDGKQTSSRPTPLGDYDIRKLVAIGFIILGVVLFSLSIAGLVKLASESEVLVSANEWWSIGGRILVAAALAALSVTALRAGRLRW